MSTTVIDDRHPSYRAGAGLAHKLLDAGRGHRAAALIDWTEPQAERARQDGHEAGYLFCQGFLHVLREHLADQGG